MRQFARNAAHFLLLQITRLSVGADRIRINVACSIETIVEGASSPFLPPNPGLTVLYHRLPLRPPRTRASFEHVHASAHPNIIRDHIHKDRSRSGTLDLV